MGEFEDKLAARRAEQKAASVQAQKDQEMARAKRESERKYVNPPRREEAQTRFKELMSPSQPAARPKAAPPVSGNPIVAYCWKDGIVGTIELNLVSGFTPLPPP